MERAAFTEAFFLDRQIGAAILAGGEHWSFQTGYLWCVTRRGATTYLGRKSSTRQTAYSVRGTVAPINREVNGVNQVLHFGASYRHRDAGERHEVGLGDCTSVTTMINALFRYRARGADLHLADRFVDTPFNLVAKTTCSSSRRHLCGDRSRCRANMRSSEARHLGQPAGYRSPRPIPTYKGWYVDASLYLTGETRNYEAATGEFRTPQGQEPGVWGSGGVGRLADRRSLRRARSQRQEHAIVDFNGTTGGSAQACALCGDRTLG